MSVRFGLVLITLFVSVFAKNEELIGNKVYQINLESEEQQNRLEILHSEVIDYWRYPVFKSNIDGLAMVPSTHVDSFEEQLEEIGLKKVIVIEDVYKYLKQKDEELIKTNQNQGDFTFDAYHGFEQILTHLNTLALMHSQTVKFDVVGRTEQDRELGVFKISTDQFRDPTKPIVYIEAGIIAREWITIPAAINVIEQLHRPEHADLLNQINWIIVPVANPDGYEFSHTNLRTWKKNRSVTNGDLFMCIGININRNFHINFGGVGSSTSPCSHEFAGSRPFSEPESGILQSVLQDYRDRIQMYLSIQNEGPLLSYPWRFEHAASGLFRLHHLFGLELHRNINLINERLDIASLTFGRRASGTSADYMHKNGVHYSFNLGIRQADGRDGFIIPESDIRTYIQPIWDTVKFAGNYIIRNNRNL